MTDRKGPHAPGAPEAQREPIPPYYQQKLLNATHAAGLGIKDIVRALKYEGRTLAHVAQNLKTAQPHTTEEATQVSPQATPKKKAILLDEQQNLMDQIRKVGERFPDSPITLRDVVAVLEAYPQAMNKLVVKIAAGLAETDLASPDMTEMAFIANLHSLQVAVTTKGVSIQSPNLPTIPHQIGLEGLTKMVREKRIKVRGLDLDSGVVEIKPSEKRARLEVKDKAGNPYYFIIVNTDQGLVLELREGEGKLFQ